MVQYLANSYEQIIYKLKQNKMVEVTLTLVTAVVIGLVQSAKILGMPTKFAPVLAIVLGVLGTSTLAMYQFSPEIIFAGVICGLTACGLWSGTKATIGK